MVAVMVRGGGGGANIAIRTALFAPVHWSPHNEKPKGKLFSETNDWEEKLVVQDESAEVNEGTMI